MRVFFILRCRSPTQIWMSARYLLGVSLDREVCIETETVGRRG